MEKESRLLELATTINTDDSVEMHLAGRQGTIFQDDPLGHLNVNVDEFVSSVLTYANILVSKKSNELRKEVEVELDCDSNDFGEKYFRRIAKKCIEEIESLRDFDKNVLEKLARLDWEKRKELENF